MRSFSAPPHTITRFKGSYGWLSNFYQSPITLDQIVYPSGEHAFSAEKTTDRRMKNLIAAAKTSAEAKRLGRSVNLVDGWDAYRRYDAMVRVQVAKFAPNSLLAGWLVGTGDTVLIEGNEWHDNTWGICYCGQCSNGHNLLGWILMQQRSRLRGLR
jgi:ribA/ribD-fused uncharacterized protein